jgi:hypothetical protein
LKLAFNFSTSGDEVTAMFFSQAHTPNMQQPNSAAAQPQAAPETAKKIEVVFEQGEGGEYVSLKYLTWTDGLGWCCQKTINVEEGQLDELHRALTVARHRASRRRADSGLPAQTAQVIQMPFLG